MVHKPTDDTPKKKPSKPDAKKVEAFRQNMAKESSSTTSAPAEPSVSEIKAEPLTTEQAQVAREYVQAKDAHAAAQKPVTEAQSQLDGLYNITKEGDKEVSRALKDGVSTDARAKAEAALTNATTEAKPATEAFVATEKKLEGAINNATTLKNLKEFKNGLFGEFGLNKVANGNGIIATVQAAGSAAKNTFVNSATHNKLAFGAKSAATLGGIYVAAGAFKSKNPDGTDRGILPRAAQLTLGSALAVGGAIAGRAH